MTVKQKTKPYLRVESDTDAQAPRNGYLYRVEYPKKETQLVAYVAGPISGLSEQESLRRFQLATDYLLKKGWVVTAEDFITRAATESSMSHKPYLVRCAGKEAEPSAGWLQAELKRWRSGQ